MPAAALAQKGTGDDVGVSWQGTQPDIVQLSGVVLEIDLGPCEMTTGRSTLGAHVILQSDDDRQLNVHLGPAGDVEALTAEIGVGASITAQAFRTDQLPSDAYIAKEVTVNERTYVLRDDNLRPTWAGWPSRPRGRRL